MTMRIARSETIGGISAIEVRNRLRKYGDGFRANRYLDQTRTGHFTPGYT